MEFWEEVKKDVQKGIKEGMSMVKAGATLAAKKVDALTQEGKKRYQSFDLKTKVHNEIAELGARVYYLNKQEKITIEDSKAKTIINKIRKLEEKIANLEGKKTSGSAKKNTTTKK